MLRNGTEGTCLSEWSNNNDGLEQKMLRKLTVEMDVYTNIDSMSGMRQLLRSGLDGVLINDMEKGQIREIEIEDIHGIDRRGDDQED